MWLIMLVAALVPCALADVSPWANVDCPPDVNVTIGDPDVCRVYYHCIDGFRPYPRQCPKDLHYSPTATGRDCVFRMCVEPSVSGCVDTVNADEKYEMMRPLLEAQEDDLVISIDEDAAEEDEPENNATDYPCFRDSAGNWVDKTLPNRNNCQQYYHCYDGIAWIDECPPTMFYTPVISWLGPLEDCLFVTCVDIDDAKCAIDGQWSAWGEWGDCSIACGDGLQVRRRLCDNPPPQNGGDDCPGSDIDAKLCNLGDCRANATVVFVATSVDLATGTTEVDPVEFQIILANTDNSFNPMDQTFTAPINGNYFIAINAGALTVQPVGMYLKGTGAPPLGNRRTHQGHVGRDSLNSNTIIPLMAGDRLRMAAAADTSLAADAGRPTSWAIFNVDEIGNSNSLFAYAYDAPNANPTNPLQFNINLTDVNSGYDPSTGFFRPILPGIWFLTYGAGVDSTSANTLVDFTMSCSGVCGSGFVSTKINRAHSDYQGIDNMARSVIVELNAGSQILVTSSNAFWSDAGLPVSFSGFFYQPDEVANRIAWFVTRNGIWEDVLPLDPVNFNREVVNVGDGWGAEVANYYTVPVSGYYLIILSAGAMSNSRVDYRLYKNDEYIFDIYRQSLAHDAVDTISRTGIFHFEQADRLRLRAIGNTALYSSVVGYETSFGGLLLHPGQASLLGRQEAEHAMDGMKV